ncbi:hypothetical protein HHK36_020191 [Tetracentron sinense]|uniref:Uncharacterized protein n=1 Tax=Tetracentron sinense TaxID=13715 RepID=A0A834YR85_TETSI|nr:hypothetical protein HHK36_020191 [Tetracentron sinense]
MPMKFLSYESIVAFNSIIKVAFKETTFILIDSPRRMPMVPSQNENQSPLDSDGEVENKREGKEQLNHPITTSDCVKNIEEKLAQVCRWEKENARFNRSIFRVPKNLREVELKAYIPQLVSIGPYHRGKAHLKEMESNKWRLLQQVLERKGHQVSLYYMEMLNLEEKMRRCYARPFENINSPEFVEMMLLDACFVVELLNVSVNGDKYYGYSRLNRMLTSLGLLPCIKRDMLMLENQIPLFVLDKLYPLITSNPGEINSVSKLSLKFFDSAIPVCQNLHHEVTNSNDPGLHLLHVVHQCLNPTPSDTSSRNKDGKEHQPHRLMGHSVMTLRRSGVRFKKNPSKNFMDIKFEKGILYIPSLVIHDSTMSIFLNLMALEQFNPYCSNYVTSYIRFMDGLINTYRDVEYLRYKGIIDHKLGSEQEVARLVNKFCKEIAFDMDDCYLSDVYAEVNEYVDQKWHVWRAILKHEYFTNPWATLSLLAASILLLLTLLQTIYTVIAYYK